MERRTDSQLRNRWEEIASGNAVEHVHEREIIIREWLEILDRKRAGEITDPSRVLVVKKAIAELAAIHDIQLELSENESNRDENLIPRFHVVNAEYMGPTTAFDAKRFLSFVIKVTEELIPQNAIVSWEKPDKDPMLYVCQITNVGGTARWLTDAHIWGGPVTIRGRRGR